MTAVNANHIEKAYYWRDPSTWEGYGLPDDIERAWLSSWKGDIFAAHEILNEIVTEKVPPPIRALVEADRILHGTKIGAGLSSPRTPIPFFTMAGAVHQYAIFSHYFWVDHRAAWKALIKLFFIACATMRASLVVTSIFLIGHMTAIAGARRFGLALASACFALVLRMQTSPRHFAPFAKNIVFAAYPYTLFVTARISRLTDVIEKIRPHLPADPYYLSIFQVSCLYTFAYTGDIVRTEATCDAFKRLHRHGKLLRYKPISALMAHLPLALRGYPHLVEKAVRELIKEHNELACDPTINSQFFRIASLVSLCLGDNAAAHTFITKAGVYRRIARFGAWKDIDGRISAFALSRSRFDPANDDVLGFRIRSGPDMPLSRLLLKIITRFRDFIDDPGRFVETLVEDLKIHFDWPSIRVQTAPPSILERMPAIRVGDAFVVFEGLPDERIDYVREALSGLAPALIVIGQSVDDVRAINRRAAESSRLAAIGQTTQMLAHDVRKPFAMVGGVLRILESVEDAATMRQVAGRYIPDVDKALASVNTMLADIIEVGAKRKTVRQAVDVASIVKAALEENLRFAPDADVTLGYDFRHASCMSANDVDMTRVVSNLVANALQAMGNRGRLTFSTTESATHVTLAVGNDGPAIPDDIAGNLFEPFITRGKKSGTGLGLAIARKIVEDHEGGIACHNDAAGPVFTLSLPKHAATSVLTADGLPRHSAGLRAERIPPREDAVEAIAVEAPIADEACLVQELRRATAADGDPLRVLMVEDEAMHRDWLARMIAKDPAWRSAIALTAVEDPVHALAMANAQRYDLILMDIDLGQSAAMNGFEAIAALRARGVDAVIAIHSNRVPRREGTDDMLEGADAFLPKPLRAVAFLRLALDALARKRMRPETASVTLAANPAADHSSIAKGAATEAARGALVIVIDDCPIVRHQWAKAQLAAEVLAFASPEESLAALAADPSLARRAQAWVIDHYFDDTSRMTGVELARSLHEKGVASPFYLASNGDFGADETALFAAVIPKGPRGYPGSRPLGHA